MLYICSLKLPTKPPNKHKIKPNTKYLTQAYFVKISILPTNPLPSIPFLIKNIPAIVEAWYPGQSGGKAVAEVLFGDYNPGGKLPMTFYTGVDQLPPFDDYDIRNGRTYMYLKDRPLYPFGHGLSYTEFSFTEFSLNLINYALTDTLVLSFTLENIGDRSGSEVPQVYIKNDGVKRLKGFERVFVDKGESKRVELKVPVQHLELWNEIENQYKVSKGQYSVQLGTDSENIIFSENILPMQRIIYFPS